MFLSLLLLFQCEAYFASEDGNYLCCIKADNQAVVVAAKQAPDEMLNWLKEFYRVAELNPGDPWYEIMVQESNPGTPQ
jgi:hypothetical protein